MHSVGGILKQLLEVDVVHCLARAVGVAVLQAVLQPQVQRVDVELLREEVHRALPRPGGLHLAVAPERTVGWKVGVDGARVNPDVGDTVRPRGGEAHLLCNARPAVGVSPGVGPALYLAGDERPVASGPDLDPDRRRVAVERQPHLVAPEHYLDRPFSLARQGRRYRLSPNERLRPERPSHRGRDYPDPLLVDAEEPGEVRAHVERGLRAGSDLQPIAVPARNSRTGLHRRVRRSGRAVGLLDHGVGHLEAGLDVTSAEPEEVADVRSLLRADAEVRRIVLREVDALADQRRVGGQGRPLVENRGQFFVLDVYEVDDLVCFLRGFGGDGADDVPGVPDPLLGKALLVLYLRSVPTEVRDVLRPQHDHALGDRRGVYGHDPGVGHRRSHEAGVQHPLRPYVLRVADCPGYACVSHL